MNQTALNTIIEKFRPVTVENAVKPEIAGEHGTKRCICVRGERSCGKTTLLTDARDMLSSQNFFTYFSFNQEGDDVMKSILKQLIVDYNNNKDSDFIESIKSYAYNKKSNETDFDKGTILKFIHDCINCIEDKHVIFIIDDLDKADDFTVEMLEKLTEENENLNVLFSCRIGFNNAALTNIIKHRANDLVTIELDPNPVSDAL